ncbi:hypothetical protein O9G_005921 [Rozella allomycis CSF55]|uniref:Uncharacterized protein n=2 Tax=Rozella allomycis (strain CSF55) TaxID=988480 RepID=A0A075AT39_ROZAC|nr:hypothetical protein O9G_005921 [Rozella allomycis CSF55]|eukprot:EPZ33428.1 hypothetical protein O9G_005921 [Rozella allomycis CSF55]
MGRGRTTTGMIITLMLSIVQKCSSDFSTLESVLAPTLTTIPCQFQTTITKNTHSCAATTK